MMLLIGTLKVFNLLSIPPHGFELCDVKQAEGCRWVRFPWKVLGDENGICNCVFVILFNWFYLVRD